MSLYNDILNEIQGFEESHTPISNIAHQKDFTIMECEKSDDPTDEYECFHAEKTDRHHNGHHSDNFQFCSKRHGSFLHKAVQMFFVKTG